MKVLVVSRGVKQAGAASAGGAELVMLRLAEQAADRGHEVHFVTDTAAGAEIDPRIRVHPVGVPVSTGNWLRRSGFFFWIVLHFLGNLTAFWRAARLMSTQEQPFDVVHCHGNLAGLLLSYFKNGATLIYSEHDSTPWSCRYPSRIQSVTRKVLYTLLNARLFRRADLTLVLYAAQKAEIVNRWGADAGSIDVVPNGVDTERFSPGSEPLAGSVEAANGYCLFVGRLEARKGVDTLIRALARCDTTCLIVGDGPDRARLEALAQNLDVADRVSFVGAISNTSLATYYSNARMFVLPSHSEAFPLSLLESMACGTPFIASRVGANEDMASSTRAGLLFEPGDHGALASRMSELIDDEIAAREMGDRGRQAVTEVYSWPEVGVRLEQMYQSFGQASPRGTGAHSVEPAVDGEPAQARVPAPAERINVSNVSLPDMEHVADR